METPKTAECANIGKSVVIKGEVSGSEDLYVDGQVEGSLELAGNNLTVGPNGQILGLEFYRCNARSHCMAYIPSGISRGLTHIGIEVHSLDDVGRAWDMVQERGIPIKMTLGRHTMDNLVSFYIRSPSGFEFEYGAGGDLLDDASFIMQKPNKAEVWGHKFMLEGWGSTVKPVVR